MFGSNDTNAKIDQIVDDLVDQYEFADNSDRSWIIGFSGGKDSTVLLMLVWKALQKLRDTIPNYRFRRMVYVVCNDTLVENPIIKDYVHDVLGYLQRHKQPLFARPQAQIDFRQNWDL